MTGAHPVPETSPAEPPADPEAGSGKLGTGVYVAVLAFTFLVLRVFAVSGYDWDTAFLVTTTLGLDDGLGLLFGSLMGENLLVAVLLVGILPLMIATSLWAPRGYRSRMALPAALGLVVLMALTFSFQRWWLPVTSAALLGLFALIRRRRGTSRLLRASTTIMTKVGWVAGVAVLLVAALVQTPWVPLENIETTDGLIVGYVLSVDSGYLNVLTEDQEFKILISGDVLSRK